MSHQLHLVLNPVHAARADDFERFLRDVIAPAMVARRPDLDGRWRAMRTAEDANGVVTFAFLLEGGSLPEDWELNNLLPDHFGKDEAERLLNDWVETFAPIGPWAEAAAEDGKESGQAVWTLDPVSLAPQSFGD